jgi:Zn-dependent protease
VLLGEPSRTALDLNFQLFGIPVRVHPFFWIMAAFLGSQGRDAREVLIWVVAVFVGVLVHELGHATAMRSYGLWPWITFFGLGGLTSVNPSLVHRSRAGSAWAQVLISLAGPLAGFFLAAAIIAILRLAGRHVLFVLPNPVPFLGSIRPPELGEFIWDLLAVSIYWGILNLMPIYPLDGGQIAREILVAFSPRGGIVISLVISLIVAGAMAVVGIVLWKSMWTGIFFGYLAYSSYATLQAYQHRRPW